MRIIPRALAASEISGLIAANLPASTGGTVLADAGNSVGSTVLAANENGGEAANLFALVLLGSVLFVIPVGAVQLWQTPKYRTRLRLTWRRHRVTVGKIVSMVSLVGLLVNSVFLVPVVQAAPAAAPSLGPVQSPWVSADIGSVGVAGSADETSGTFTIDGAGANIAGTVDAFHFVYQSLTGDGSITANAVSLSGGGSTPRMGLMMRNSLADDAAHVASVIQGNRIRVLDRASSGGNTTEVAGHTQGAPEWLRIERSGNTFTLSRSNDGSSWAVMQTRTITMGATIYVGMAVTGNSTTTLATGVFDNVTVANGGGGATITPTPTATATGTATTTPTSTNTATPTNTPWWGTPEPIFTPTPTVTNTPTPTPTVPPPPAQPEVIVQRTTYSIAGQAVFLRIRTLEDGVEADNRLYAMHTDHLGSTSTLSYLDPVAGTAYQLQDARALYEPFGDYRVEPTGEYTDRGYTGHLGNNSGSNDIGLIYMNARYYVSGIARFASADTIVPSAANPQSFNRYSYVLNSPLKHNDPSGHCAVDPYDDYADYDCWNEYNTLHERIESYGYDPLEYLGAGEEWEYLGINLDEGFLLEAYDNEEWHQQVPGGTYSEFVQGYIFYAIYQQNPELAFDHSVISAVTDGMSEPDSYTLANIYSVVIEGSYFTPYGDQQYYNAIDEARANGNEDLAYRLSVILTVGMPENNSGLPDIPVAPTGGAFSEIADAFTGWLDELFSGLVGE